MNTPQKIRFSAVWPAAAAPGWNPSRPCLERVGSAALAGALLWAGAISALAQPVITSQPQSVTNLAGTTATFSVTAAGTPPLAFQWQRDTGLLDFYDFAARTDATLVLTNVALSDAVNYRVIVTNPSGAITSTVASLTVFTPPRITQQPAYPQGVAVSATVTLRVGASGTPPPSYQWRFNGGAPISQPNVLGQTSAVLSLTNAQAGNSGGYDVVVSNAAGAVTSQVAVLKVFAPALHRLDSASLTSNGDVLLRLAGEVSAPFAPYYDLYPLEVSSNLLDWTPLAAITRTNLSTVPLTYLDRSAAGWNSRFYRTATNLLITPLPPLTGPYAVGTFSRLMTDPSRTNRYFIRTNSSFMATFWYPAQAKAGQLPGPYTDSKLASYGAWWGPVPTLVLHFVSHAFAAAPIATNDNTYPVIIYSHGFYPEGVRVENTAAATELASHGYIVVAIDHIDCYGSVFPNQTMVLGAIASDCAAVCNNPGPYWQSRLQDVQFLLGELSRIAQSDPVLANRLDLDHIGIMGWSFGGGTAAEACRTNSQIKAAALLDARLDPSPKLLSLGLQKPFLAMNCPDSSVLVPQNNTLFSLATNVAYILQILYTQPNNGMDVCGSPTFTDEAWINGPSAQSRQAGQAMCACTVSFFNKLFKNQDDHLLDAPTNTFSNIVRFRKKP